MLRGLYSHTVPVIKSAELKEQMQQKQPPVLLDARAPEEYKVSHLKGARLVGYDTFEVSKLKDIPKNTPLVVYCSVGYRSEKVGEQLQEAGFTNVRNLYGGLFDWVNTGLPVYNKAGRTKQVHAYAKSWGIWLHKGEKVYGAD
ncbi:rhodanese-like domain-containing protein [Pontibacter arcticus]|uniref:Rhodanese-like domain-containing protein n=2 Tax=Pontibacter arcticus TaxID=2080288 RepID=A0A364RCN4_9BACT|nr:rhodanese-like domain-containing protein [Pontibacter arcticus]